MPNTFPNNWRNWEWRRWINRKANIQHFFKASISPNLTEYILLRDQCKTAWSKTWDSEVGILRIASASAFEKEDLTKLTFQWEELDENNHSCGEIFFNLIFGFFIEKFTLADKKKNPYKIKMNGGHLFIIMSMRWKWSHHLTHSIYFLISYINQLFFKSFFHLVIKPESNNIVATNYLYAKNLPTTSKVIDRSALVGFFYEIW